MNLLIGEKSPTRKIKSEYKLSVNTDLDKLPEDIIQKIASELDYKSLNNLLRVSTRFRDILTDRYIKKLLTRKLIENNQPHGNIVHGNISETYFLGKLHSINDEPAFIEYNDLDQVLCEKWYNNGMIIYEIKYINGVSKISETWYENDIISHKILYYGQSYIKMHEIWYKNGEIYYELFYANSTGEIYLEKKYNDISYSIGYYDNGKIIHEIFYTRDNNKIYMETKYNKNKYFTVVYFKNGKIKSRIWSINSVYNYHRKNDRPAFIEYNEDGKIISQSWYKNGKLYRKNNPAIIIYNNIGVIIKQEWYENNILIKSTKI